jgi:multidrug efflux pump subunit AcrA (membrane-fusion protein)
MTTKRPDAAEGLKTEKASKSTGPKSAAGKAKSARNAVKHGLSRPHLTPELSAAAQALAAEMLADDPTLNPTAVGRIAELRLQQAQLRRAQEAELDRAMAQTDEALPFAARQAQAYLGSLDRVAPLIGYQDRMAGSLRKQLRKL